MNKYVTLVKHELKSIKLLIFIFATFMYFSGIETYKESIKEMIITYLNYPSFAVIEIPVINPCINLICFIFPIFLAEIQFDSKNNKILFELPFTKNELFIAKTFIGTVLITLIFILYTLAEIVIFNKNKLIIQRILSVCSKQMPEFITNGNLILAIIYLWFIFILIYTITIFFMLCVKNRKLSVICFFGTVFLPYSIVYIFGRISMYLFGKISNNANFLNPINIINANFTIYRHYGYHEYMYNIKTYIIYLSILFVFFITLAYKLYKRWEQAENVNLFTFRWAEYIFIFCSGLYGIIISSLFVISFFHSEILLISVIIIGFLLGIKISYKICDMNGIHLDKVYQRRKIKWLNLYQCFS